jgi:ABC-2 type transport system ATP-binding protein
VYEALELFGSFYSKRVDGDVLLRRLQLWEKREAGYATLSGGQKQRLALALALINDPQMLFLDEPTTGLDPQVRLEIRDLIEELRAEKRTILMTTHYIEEAERLCDRVAIIDDGVIIAIGSPRELQEKSATQSSIEISLGRPLPAVDLPAWPDAIRTTVSDDRCKISVSSGRAAKTLVELIKWIDAQGLELDDVHLNRPTLEDVFIELTGKRLRD